MSLLRLGIHSGRLCVSPAVRLCANVRTDGDKRTLTSLNYKKPSNIKPYPYETFPYKVWQSIQEDTASRFDENTRIVVVEGNVGVGKSTLAKQIAKEFGLLHFPEADMSMKYVNDTGFDLRSLDDKLPPILRHMDMDRFYREPKSPMVPSFRYDLLGIRFEQYLDAMAHLLHTGQGVVLERSPYSDFVMVEAMMEHGYFNRTALKTIKEMWEKLKAHIWRPHVIIYLDAPVDVLKKRIEKRGNPSEVNSKVLSSDYLRSIEQNYKEKYLREAKDHSELMIYDWTNFVDEEIVVEDIERMPVEKVFNDPYDRRMGDWKRHRPRSLDNTRMIVTNDKVKLLHECVINIQRYDTRELVAGVENVNKYNEVMEKHLPEYSPGFEPEKGSSYMWRTDINLRHEQRVYFRTR